MKWMDERTSKTQIIATMAILSALVAALSAFCAVFPWGMPILTFLAPLASVFVALTCPGSSLPLFVLSALFTSFLTSFFDVQGLLFYLLPALILGATYGRMIRKKYDFPRILFWSAMVECGLFFLSIPVSKLIYGITFYDVFSSPIFWGKSTYASFIFPLFCLAYSFGQSLITHLFTSLVFGNRYLPRISDIPKNSFLAIGGVVSLTVLVFFSRVYIGVSYMGLGCLFFFCVASFLGFHSLSKWQIGIYVLALFVSILLFASLYSLFPSGFGLLLFAIPFSFILAINLGYLALRNGRANNKMERQWHS